MQKPHTCICDPHRSSNLPKHMSGSVKCKGSVDKLRAEQVLDTLTNKRHLRI